MDAPQGGTDRDKSNPSSSPVSVVSNFWKEFDLEKEKSVLDEQGLRIAENQENSQKNRQKLAESTRDFKKASAEEKLSLFNSLLKGYQEEDDNLTKRAKFGENVFLNIYQKLYEARDRYPALALIAEHDLKISELESENRKMKLELEEFRTEAMHLKNRQATTRRFEERNHQLEQQSHKDATQFRARSFAFYEQLCQIYAKDRALGRDAQTGADILEEIIEEGNVQTAIDIHDAEDENQSHPALEDMDISSTQRLASTSTSTKKRKTHEMGEPIYEESFIKAATLLGDKIKIVGKELSKSIGSEMIIQQRVQELYSAFCEIDGLTEDELDIALSKIPNQRTQMLVFF